MEDIWYEYYLEDNLRNTNKIGACCISIQELVQVHLLLFSGKYLNKNGDKEIRMFCISALDQMI